MRGLKDESGEIAEEAEPGGKGTAGEAAREAAGEAAGGGGGGAGEAVATPKLVSR